MSPYRSPEGPPTEHLHIWRVFRRSPEDPFPFLACRDCGEVPGWVDRVRFALGLGRPEGETLDAREYESQWCGCPEAVGRRYRGILATGRYACSVHHCVKLYA